MKTYDENQMDTVLRACDRCGKPWYMRPWRFTCIDCLKWPHQGIER